MAAIKPAATPRISPMAHPAQLMDRPSRASASTSASATANNGRLMARQAEGSATSTTVRRHFAQQDFGLGEDRLSGVIG